MNAYFIRNVFRWRGGVLLIAWLSLGFICPAGSQGQQSCPPRQVAAVPSQQTTPARRAVAIRGSNDPNYWIVSARCCKQQLECCQNCNFGVYRFDGPTCRQSTLDELYGSLDPGIPVCFMVHGSFVRWDSMLRDSAGTYKWLRNAAPDKPVQMVFFTWPSDDTSNLIPNAIDTVDARRLGRLAELNALYLAQLITRVPDANPISLIGHSHGARMVSATLHLLGGGTVEGRCFDRGPYNRHRIRAVLAAAAMDHDWFNPGERFDLALGSAEAMINVRNRHDFPLFFHPTHQLFASSALGRSGVTWLDQCQLGPEACRIAECDVTALVGFRHYWPYYYREPGIACAIRHYVYFDETQQR